jgi:hypothetical protein
MCLYYSPQLQSFNKAKVCEIILKNTSSLDLFLWMISKHSQQNLNILLQGLAHIYNQTLYKYVLIQWLCLNSISKHTYYRTRKLKRLKRFIQVEPRICMVNQRAWSLKFVYDLAGWAWHEGRDTQDKISNMSWDILGELYPPHFNFAECRIKFGWWNSPMNVILCCIILGWIYLVFSFVLSKW